MAVLLIFAGVGAGWHMTRPAIAVSGEAASAVSKVLRAYQWGRVSGEYWEGEFVRQSLALKARPLQERLEFYEAILIDCDLDTSRATIFVEEVGRDAQPLMEALKQLSRDPKFSNFSQSRKAAVISWIEELDIIVKTQKILAFPGSSTSSP